MITTTRFGLGETVRGAALAPPLFSELEAALAGSELVVEGVTINDANATPGLEIAVVTDEDPFPPDAAIIAATVAAHDVDDVEREVLPALPATLQMVPAQWVEVVRWTVPDAPSGWTCTYDLDLRGRYGTGQELRPVRVVARGSAVREPGESVDARSPSASREPGSLRLRVTQPDDATVALELFARWDEVLTLSPESTLKVVLL